MADVSHRIILTGASGMLGKAILEELANNPSAEVLALYRGNLPSTASDNIQNASCNLQSGDAVENFLEEFEPTIFIHSAATGMQTPLPDKETFHQVNVELPARLAKIVAGRSHFVHVSSGLAYTDQGRPLREDDPLGTRHPYGASKVEAEKRLLEIANSRDFSLTVLRPFSFTGKGDFGSKLFPSLLRSSEKGEPFKMSTGEQVRDHASVRDIARGVVAASLLPAPASKPRIFNLGSGDCRSLREVVLDVTKQLAVPVEIQFGERPRLPDEPMFMVADTTRAQNELGWITRENLACAVWQLAQNSFPALKLKEPAPER